MDTVQPSAILIIASLIDINMLKIEPDSMKRSQYIFVPIKKTDFEFAFDHIQSISKYFHLCSYPTQSSILIIHHSDSFTCIKTSK